VRYLGNIGGALDVLAKDICSQSERCLRKLIFTPASPVCTARDDQFDVIVVGVGGIGSSVTYRLAKRGIDVLGLERYDVPHIMSSSHGYTRVIRLA